MLEQQRNFSPISPRLDGRGEGGGGLSHLDGSQYPNRTGFVHLQLSVGLWSTPSSTSWSNNHCRALQTEYQRYFISIFFPRGIDIQPPIPNPGIHMRYGPRISPNPLVFKRDRDQYSTLCIIASQFTIKKFKFLLDKIIIKKNLKYFLCLILNTSEFPETITMYVIRLILYVFRDIISIISLLHYKEIYKISNTQYTNIKYTIYNIHTL